MAPKKFGESQVEISVLNRVGKGLSAIESQMKKFGAGLSGFGSRMAGIGGGITAAFGGIGAALAFPTKLAIDLEQTTTSFETMLGSAEKAQAMLTQLRDFAASTPLQFNEITGAAKKLLAFGVAAEDVEAELRRVGDIATGIGAPIGEIAEIYGKAKVQGRLFAEDINQLTGRGIPIIQELAKQFGITDGEVKKLVESGEVGFENLQTAFQAMTSDGGQFFGMMEKQSKTLGGLISTLRDNVMSALVPIGQSVAEVLKPIVTQLIAMIGPISEVIKRNAGMAKMLAILAVGGATAGVAIVTLGTALAGAGFVISGVATVVGTLGTVLGFVLSPLGLITAGIVAAAAAFGVAFVRTGMLTHTLEGLKASFAGMQRVVAQVSQGISDALAAGQPQLAAKILWKGLEVIFRRGIATLTGEVLKMTARIFTTFVNLNNEIFKLMKGFGKGLLTGEFGSGIGKAMGALAGEGIAEAQGELDGLLNQAERLKNSKQIRDRVAERFKQADARAAQARPNVRQPNMAALQGQMQQQMKAATKAVQNMQRAPIPGVNAPAIPAAAGQMPLAMNDGGILKQIATNTGDTVEAIRRARFMGGGGFRR